MPKKKNCNYVEQWIRLPIARNIRLVIDMPPKRSTIKGTIGIPFTADHSEGSFMFLCEFFSPWAKTFIMLRWSGMSADFGV